MSNFKRMVRARMAETGEGWQRASAAVRAAGARAVASCPHANLPRRICGCLAGCYCRGRACPKETLP